MPWEADNSESNFNLAKETYRIRIEIDAAFVHTTFPLSSPAHGSGAPSSTTESDHSAPVSRDKNKPYFYKEGAGSFHSLVQSGT